MTHAFLLKIQLAPEGKFMTIAGMRVLSESALPGGGYSLLSQGVFTSFASLNIAGSWLRGHQLIPAMISFEDGQLWQGGFHLNKLEYAGEVMGDTQWKVILESRSLVRKERS